jgi:hypothetical protein
LTVGLVVALGSGCSELGLSGEGFVRVTLRNEDSRPIYLCVPAVDSEDCGIAQITNFPAPEEAFLDAGSGREVLLEMDAGALEGTFYAVREVAHQDFDGTFSPQYELQMISSCRTIADYEDLKASRPEVVWTGSAIQCRNWLL